MSMRPSDDLDATLIGAKDSILTCPSATLSFLNRFSSARFRLANEITSFRPGSVRQKHVEGQPLKAAICPSGLVVSTRRQWTGDSRAVSSSSVSSVSPASAATSQSRALAFPFPFALDDGGTRSSVGRWKMWYGSSRWMMSSAESNADRSGWVAYSWSTASAR